MSQATIYAKTLWNRTGIDLEKGTIYRFEVQGTWHDASIVCDGDGFAMRDGIPCHLWPLFWTVQWLRPFPTTGERWFQLVGKVGGQAFLIGNGGTFEAPGDGELLCAANDAQGFYYNNDGELTLTVTRVDTTV